MSPPPLSPPSSPACRLVRDSVQRAATLEDRFDDLRLVSRGGAFGGGAALLACRCRSTGQLLHVRLRAKSATKFSDFRREYAYSRFLSAHPCVVNTYETALETPDEYALVQERPPVGDLASFLGGADGGGGVRPRPQLDEAACKLVAEQLLSALEFMRGEALVHRDVRPENVLLFDAGCRRVKLAGFAHTCRAGAVVRRAAELTPYMAPELCERVRHEGYEAATPADVWAAGVVIVQVLTGDGDAPWDAAVAAHDKRYASFRLWHRHQTLAMPTPRWRKFTPKLLKMLRQLLEPSEGRRCSAADAAKYCRSRWIQQRPSLRRRAAAAAAAKKARDGGHDSGGGDGGGGDEGVREGNVALRELLASKGVPSTVTKKGRLARISDWLSSSDSLQRLTGTVVNAEQRGERDDAASSDCSSSSADAS